RRHTRSKRDWSSDVCSSDLPSCRIVFVTHDIDEAIKLGDRIAILQEGSRVAQYDTPEQILTAPANDFVSDFIGRGASLKRLNLKIGRASCSERGERLVCQRT